jgi:putative hemolysin
MSHVDQNLETLRQPRLVFQYARTEREVRAVQKVRWKVFHEEMGACLRSSEPGVDIDRFDALCDHLLVRDTRNNEVVGTYRILNALQAEKAGGFYSDGEFDLSRLTHLRARILAVGRACVHPQYRSGAASDTLNSHLRIDGGATLLLGPVVGH